MGNRDAAVLLSASMMNPSISTHVSTPSLSSASSLHGTYCDFLLWGAFDIPLQMFVSGGADKVSTCCDGSIHLPDPLGFFSLVSHGDAYLLGNKPQDKHWENRSGIDVNHELHERLYEPGNAPPSSPSELRAISRDGGARSGSTNVGLSQPVSTTRNLIPHWSYQKSSIAAASIFTGITVIALVFLGILSVRKMKRSWERHKREKREYAASRYSALPMMEEAQKDKSTGDRQRSRETLMFSRTRSQASTYVVEQEGPSVTRAYRANKSVSTLALDSLSPSIGETSSTTKVNSIPERPVNALKALRHERHGSLPKSPVVVPSPLKPVPSFSVKPITRRPATPEVPEQMPLTLESEAVVEIPQNNKRESKRESKRQSKRESFGANSIFKLPTIQRTMSPLFSF
ncbi:hypothetical protein BO71DRAFT_487965 [Aspergillus ellipticus CBS 707.79]|uniref:Uncharacterized protein n=1 Tax=Aspergillus ellipticus CBS 707.79 TaxID=1448320 RepID=A0A319EEG1_9EURO|nr:hypothetical protein BO71DRAFT_487965 [Aspergillus ellipticus CBS 707.79]